MILPFGSTMMTVGQCLDPYDFHIFILQSFTTGCLMLFLSIAFQIPSFSPSASNFPEWIPMNASPYSDSNRDSRCSKTGRKCKQSQQQNVQKSIKTIFPFNSLSNHSLGELNQSSSSRNSTYFLVGVNYSNSCLYF